MPCRNAVHFCCCNKGSTPTPLQPNAKSGSTMIRDQHVLRGHRLFLLFSPSQLNSIFVAAIAELIPHLSTMLLHYRPHPTFVYNATSLQTSSHICLQCYFITELIPHLSTMLLHYRAHPTSVYNAASLQSSSHICLQCCFITELIPHLSTMLLPYRAHPTSVYNAASLQSSSHICLQCCFITELIPHLSTMLLHYRAHPTSVYNAASLQSSSHICLQCYFITCHLCISRRLHFRWIFPRSQLSQYHLYSITAAVPYKISVILLLLSHTKPLFHYRPSPIIAQFS